MLQFLDEINQLSSRHSSRSGLRGFKPTSSRDVIEAVRIRYRTGCLSARYAPGARPGLNHPHIQIPSDQPAAAKQLALRQIEAQYPLPNKLSRLKCSCSIDRNVSTHIMYGSYGAPEQASIFDLLQRMQQSCEEAPVTIPDTLATQDAGALKYAANQEAVPLKHNTDHDTQAGNTEASGEPVEAVAILVKPFLIILFTLLACLGWLVSSSGIIVVNKVLLVDMGLPYPLAVASIGMGACSLFSFLYIDVLHMIPGVNIDWHFYITRVVPVSLAQGLSLWLGNGLYLFLTVAFIEMARSAMPLFVMIALHCTGLESPTTSVVMAVGITSVGCAVSAFGELGLTTIGVLALMANFSCETARLVLMQKLLVNAKWHPMQGLRIFCPGVFAFLGALSFVKENPTMVSTGDIHIAMSKDTLPFIFLGGLLALLANLLSLVIITLSSATTLKLLACVRGPLVVTLGVVLFSETVTGLQAVGYIIAIFGFAWYQHAKTQQGSDSGSESPRGPTRGADQRQKSPMADHGGRPPATRGPTRALFIGATEYWGAGNVKAQIRSVSQGADPAAMNRFCIRK
eukprot:gene13238-19074_t